MSLVILATLLAVQTDDETRLKELAEAFVEKKPYLAVSVGVIHGDKVSSFAVGKIGDEKPNAETVYEIGSITKVFTGTLLADSALRGIVKLDQPLQTGLPDEVVLPTRDGRQITLLHAATHTTSLPVQPPSLPLTAIRLGTPSNPYSKFEFSHLASSLEKLELSHPIGSRFAYSNLGVGLLGHSLAAANGADTYEAALRQRVLDPLGMSGTRIQLTEPMRARLAPGHGRLGFKASGWDFGCLEACGGLRSSVSDMLKFAAASMKVDDSDPGRAFAHAKQVWRQNDRRGRDCTGLCWLRMQSDSIAGDVWWHNGGTGGYRSFLGTIPKKHIAVVVLTNSSQSVDRLALEMLEVLSPGRKAK